MREGYPLEDEETGELLLINKCAAVRAQIKSIHLKKIKCGRLFRCVVCIYYLLLTLSLVLLRLWKVNVHYVYQI